MVGRVNGASCADQAARRVPRGVSVSESRVTNVQTSTDRQPFFPTPSVDETQPQEYDVRHAGQPASLFSIRNLFAAMSVGGTRRWRSLLKMKTDAAR